MPARVRSKLGHATVYPEPANRLTHGTKPDRANDRSIHAEFAGWVGLAGHCFVVAGVGCGDLATGHWLRAALYSTEAPRRAY